MAREILNDVPIDDIKPYGRNPRKNDGLPVEEVAKSLQKVGYRTPIIVDEDNVILCGHTRYKAIKQIGWEKIPFVVKFTDLTPEQKKQYRILDNKTGEFAEWDFDILTQDFTPEELKEIGFDNTFDYSDKNRELSTADLSGDMKIVLEYTEDEYWKVKEQLSKIGQTPEQAVWKLLGNE